MVLFHYHQQAANRMKQGNGFTLLELLIVLSIWSVLLLIITPIIHTRIMTQQDEPFLDTLEFDFLYMQRLSTLTKDYVSFRVRTDHYVITQGSGAKVILRRELPSGWKINMKSLTAISFDENGRVRQPYTITLTTNQSIYNIIFPLGKGRCYVVEK